MQGVGWFCETPSPRLDNPPKSLADLRRSRTKYKSLAKPLNHRAISGFRRPLFASVGVYSTVDTQNIVIQDGVDAFIDDHQLI